MQTSFLCLPSLCLEMLRPLGASLWPALCMRVHGSSHLRAWAGQGGRGEQCPCHPCFCPGLFLGLFLGQPQESGSLGFRPKEVGGWEGGEASCWQAPLQTAVLCRCL